MRTDAVLEGGDLDGYSVWNLQVLRDSIATESVDLIYLDPPFNSNATYNVGLLGESGHLAEWALTSAYRQERT